MKQTPFTHLHRALGAKMVEFAGYEMPVEYTGLNEEHLCVRQRVGVFDVSHMGEFWVTGPKAYDLVQRITSNDISVLSAGKAQYSCLPNGRGGIVDDLLVYHFGPEKYLLVVNAANIDKDWAWVEENNRNIGAHIENASAGTAQLAIQGPLAAAVLQTLTQVDLSTIPFYQFTTGTLAGVEVILSNTGYTGAGGFEVYMPNEAAEGIWHAIFEAGKAHGIQPIGLGARDTLRLEMGYCLYGNDIDDTTSPIEAGLGWITKFVAPNQFIDRELNEAQKNAPVRRRLKGFEMIDRGIPRHGYEICTAQGQTIGVVTSGTQSPSLKKGIGMGYIDAPHLQVGTEIYIRIRQKLLKAQVVALPFYKG